MKKRRLLVASVAWVIGAASLLNSKLPRATGDAETADQPVSANHTIGRLVRVTLPITDNADKRVKANIQRAINDFPESDSRPTLVLEFWTPPNTSAGGSEFERVLSLARYLASEELSGIRTVAFLPSSVTGHAVLAAIACEQIIMAPDAELGNAGIDEPSLEAGGFISPTIRRGYSEIAERRRTIPTAIALGMLSPKFKVVRVTTSTGVQYALEEELDELRQDTTIQTVDTIIPPGEMGQFDGRTLRRELKFISHLASDHVELAGALDLAVNQLELNPSLGKGWQPIRIDISGPISTRQVNRVMRSVEDGMAGKSANLVCFVIDSPGGMIDESSRLADFIAGIDQSTVLTVGYVRGSARSDAALVAFACDHMVMQEDALLGGSGARELTDEAITGAVPVIKQMAQAKSRRWSLMVASLDPNLLVHRYSLDGSTTTEYFCAEELAEQPDPGKWIKGEPVTNVTLFPIDARKAESLGLARYVVDDFNELKAAYQLEEDPELMEPSWAHDLVDTLSQPHVAGTLLFFAGFALVAEFMSPGLGIGGFVSAVCFSIYFWSQFLNGTAEAFEIILFLLGVVCLVVEIFVVPGFGVFGIGGGALIVASLVLASQTFIFPQNDYQFQQLPRSLMTVAGAGGGIVVGLIALRKYLHQAPLIRGVMLPTPEGDELEELQRRESMVDWNYLLGQRGITTTRLMPSGKARFGDLLVDVASRGEAISSGSNVEVIQVSGNHVVVKAIT